MTTLDSTDLANVFGGVTSRKSDDLLTQLNTLTQTLTNQKKDDPTMMILMMVMMMGNKSSPTVIAGGGAPPPPMMAPPPYGAPGPVINVSTRIRHW